MANTPESKIDKYTDLIIRMRWWVILLPVVGFMALGTGAGTFNINSHHPELLEKVFAVMAKGSTVIFSSNHQRFDPKFHKLKTKRIRELTPKTIPQDYRNKRVHRCWQIDL